MMKVGVVHPGTQHSRQTALALQQLGKLAFLATGLFDHPRRKVRAMLPFLPSRLADKLDTEMRRFAFDSLDPKLVRAFPFYELPERIMTRSGAAVLGQAVDTRLNAAFGRKIAGMASREERLALWAYDGAAWSLFTDPRTAHCPKILDRTMTDCRSWNAERLRLIEDDPEWFSDGSPAWLEKRIAQDDLEYASADRIVCGSPFVIQSILEHSPVEGLKDKLRILPYCFDETLFERGTPAEPPAAGEPVRFLFVGQVAGRKGIRHVLDAFMQCAPAEATLTVVGTIGLDDTLLAPYRDRVSFTGPVPRTQIPALMMDHHAFVFPSYHEGSAIVLLEAMAAGLAIIQTAASGLGASEESGFVLERPDTDAVATAMRTLIEDRDVLHSMRRAAKREASSRNFAAYRDNIAALLADMGI